MIQIYYGPGKGKTTAALGAAIRAIGADMKVLFVSFLKDNSSSERKAPSGIMFYENPEKIKFLGEMTESERKEYSVWVKAALNYSEGSSADIIVLDEFLDVIPLLGKEEIKNFVFKSEKEYIITGHKRDEYIFSIADYITYLEKEKHPFDKNVKARMGIEY